MRTYAALNFQTVFCVANGINTRGTRGSGRRISSGVHRYRRRTRPFNFHAQWNVCWIWKLLWLRRSSTEWCYFDNPISRATNVVLDHCVFRFEAVFNRTSIVWWCDSPTVALRSGMAVQRPLLGRISAPMNIMSDIRLYFRRVHFCGGLRFSEWCIKRRFYFELL